MEKVVESHRRDQNAEDLDDLYAVQDMCWEDFAIASNLTVKRSPEVQQPLENGSKSIQKPSRMRSSKPFSHGNPEDLQPVWRSGPHPAAPGGPFPEPPLPHLPGPVQDELRLWPHLVLARPPAPRTRRVRGTALPRLFALAEALKPWASENAIFRQAHVLFDRPCTDCSKGFGCWQKCRSCPCPAVIHPHKGTTLETCFIHAGSQELVDSLKSTTLCYESQLGMLG